MKMIKRAFFCSIFLLCISLLPVVNSQEMYVSVPITDVRIQPLSTCFKPSYPMPSSISKNLHTQLLYGDKVSVMGNVTHDLWLPVRTSQIFLNKQKNLKKEFISGYVQKKFLTKSPKRYLHNAVIKSLWAPIYRSAKKSDTPLMKLSCGSRIFVLQKEKDSWLKIQLLSGSFGYVKRNDVLFFKDIKTMPLHILHQKIIETAKQFLQKPNAPSPYVWGGRSAHDFSNKNQTTGIDCSGLTSLIYGNVYNFRFFPRTARDQYAQAPKKITSGKNLKPADLVFFSTQKGSEKSAITHVALYIGDGKILESTGLGLSTVPQDRKKAKAMCVRIISIKDLTGTHLKNLVSGQRCPSNPQKLIFFAGYIPDNPISSN